jgi:hypothetical protein
LVAYGIPEPHALTVAPRRPSATSRAPLLMLLQIHRHLGGKALSFNIRETFKAE